MRIFRFVILIITLFVFSDLSALPDSIGVKEKNGKKYILHRVEKGEGLFAIGRRYGVSVDVLREANPQTKKGLVIGEIVLVPLVKEDKIKGATYHKIKEGETLYRISRMYDIDIEKLRKWNDLKGNEIEINRELIVEMPKKGKSGNKAPAEDPPEEKNPEKRKEEKKPAQKEPVKKSRKNKNPVKNPFEERYSEKHQKIGNGGNGHNDWEKVEEEGRATWIDDTYMTSRKSLALHKTAPPGTIVKVKNLMNNKIVYVKVVGQLDPERDKNNLITISKTAARKIDVNDSYFRAHLEYAVPSEQ